MHHFCPLDKDKLCDYTFITQLTKTFSWKGPGDPDLRGRGFLSVSQFSCIDILHVIYAFHGSLIINAGNAVRFLFDFCTQKNIGESEGAPGTQAPSPGVYILSFLCIFRQKILQNKRLAHALWELVFPENPGSATEKFSFR